MYWFMEYKGTDTLNTIHSQSRRQLPSFGQRMRRSAETPLRPQGVEIVPGLSGSSPENGKQADIRPNWRSVKGVPAIVEHDCHFKQFAVNWL